jgi:rhodanese-related sulfurtransferase
MELPYMNTVYIAFGLFLLVTAYNYLRPTVSRNYTSLDSEEAHEMIEKGDNLMIIDIRTKDEYRKEHIRGAKNIPLEQLDNRISSLPHNKDIIVYCETGGQSVRAIRKLELAGFTRLFHMQQGLRGWNNEDYPTSKTGKTT